MGKWESQFSHIGAALAFFRASWAGSQLWHLAGIPSLLPDMPSDESATTIEVLSPRRVARLLGVSHTFVYDAIAAGTIPHVRIGPRRFVIERSELERFLALRRHTAEEAALRASART